MNLKISNMKRWADWYLVKIKISKCCWKIWWIVLKNARISTGRTKHYLLLKKISGQYLVIKMFVIQIIIIFFHSYRVQRLCTNWESALSHGLKTTSVFKNIVSGNLTTEVPSTSFWDFARNHLTSHEKERFSTLRYGK